MLIVERAAQTKLFLFRTDRQRTNNSSIVSLSFQRAEDKFAIFFQLTCRSITMDIPLLLHLLLGSCNVKKIWTKL